MYLHRTSQQSYQHSHKIQDGFPHAKKPTGLTKAKTIVQSAVNKNIIFYQNVDKTKLHVPTVAFIRCEMVPTIHTAPWPLTMNGLSR